MRAPERRAMVERPAKDISVRRQCTLLNLARSGVYRAKPIAGADDLALMRRIDELHLELANAFAFARIGPAARFWRGGCRKRWMRASASRPWTKPLLDMASRKSSTPIVRG
jgi:hypothetical protein